MKKSSLLIIALVATCLMSCDRVRSDTPVGGNNTKYDLQNYKLTVENKTNNCALGESSTLDCDSQDTFGGIYSISFNTPNGKPGAYVVMPPTDDTHGLNISSTSSGCNQTAPQGGETYTCNFRIGINGTAQAGNAVHLQINGSLGTVAIVKINIQ